MNKLIPMKKLSKNKDLLPALSDGSVVVNESGVPLGFVFGRDAFISLCTVIDEEFEKRVQNPAKAYDNPAGKLIDLIEEKLPVNPKFVEDLKQSLPKRKKEKWISLEEVAQMLNV